MMFYKETDFQESPIGKIPKDWEVPKLGEVVKDLIDMERHKSPRTN